MQHLIRKSLQYLLLLSFPLRILLFYGTLLCPQRPCSQVRSLLGMQSESHDRVPTHYLLTLQFAPWRIFPRPTIENRTSKNKARSRISSSANVQLIILRGKSWRIRPDGSERTTSLDDVNRRKWKCQDFIVCFQFVWQATKSLSPLNKPFGNSW
ncbi:hypothetical protein B0H12DRAFT_369637 [Mycena haematopus]|nr:hypothetical protein B0H12DRAFT_369637 [Mycena haematopus]